MKVYAMPLLAAMLALAGCDSRQADAPQAPATSAIDAPPQIPVMGPERRIVALGDSLFAGYGLRPGESYPDRLEAALRAQGINAHMTNAGVSGDTTAGGRQRLSFTLGSLKDKPDLVIISLGGNDMLRGLPPEQTRANLDAILAELDKRGIKAMLLGMLAPPNLGTDYAGKFNPIYPELAKQHHAALVPFFLQAVIDKPGLRQADHIHPTAQGVEALVADTAAVVARALPAQPL
ncbi:MAG: arylesterase [Sphingomonadales bacterium]|nr:arylesterase [Sphingomonadales bacterium]